MTPGQRIRYIAAIFVFSIIGYALGCFVHSEFWHHFFTWVFGG